MDALKKPNRADEGRAFARAILVQTPADEITEDPESNPVLRRLKAQARAGVGHAEGLLPPQVFTSLMDRLWGKPLDRVSLRTPGAKQYDAMSNEELAARCDAVARRLRGDKEGV
jgi:hypothetical protein